MTDEPIEGLAASDGVILDEIDEALALVAAEQVMPTQAVSGPIVWGLDIGALSDDPAKLKLLIAQKQLELQGLHDALHEAAKAPPKQAYVSNSPRTDRWGRKLPTIEEARQARQATKAMPDRERLAAIAEEAWTHIEYLLTEECGLHPDEGLAGQRPNCVNAIVNALRLYPATAGEWQLIDPATYVFGLLVEEFAEAGQWIGKSLRFGYDTPGRKNGAGQVSGETARDLLPIEIGDALAAIEFAILHGVLDRDATETAKNHKLTKLLNPSSRDNLGRPLAPLPPSPKEAGR